MKNVSQTKKQATGWNDSGDLLVEIFNRYCEIHGGKADVSEFKEYLDRLIKTDVKPLCK